jgi:hypothetical protein
MEEHRLMNHRHPMRYLIAALAFALVAGACSSADGGSDDRGSGGSGDTFMVEPDLISAPLNVTVVFTDDGFEPSMIFLPAGRQIRLALRNRTEAEHHFRIRGLVPGNLRWMQVPEIDEYEAATMSLEELEAFGIADVADITDEAELAHYMHHLTPTFSPVKEVSPAGIKPLGTEVHGYVTRGKQDTLTFFPLSVGRFVAEDVLHPEVTGTVIVFAVEDS